jgi:glycerophosphoryl diester phosphodiesterase
MVRALIAAAALGALAPAAATAAAPRIYAHRGGSAPDGVPKFPENTLPAFQNAQNVERAVLEFDIKLTKDNVPIVMHDDSVDRTTNCTGLVKSFTLAALSVCRSDVLGSPGSALPSRTTTARTPIPTLAQVLAFARRTGATITPEIKNLPTDRDYDPTPGYATTATRALRASGIPRSRVIIQSFWPANLDVAKSVWPGVPTSFLLLKGGAGAGPNTAKQKGYTWVSPSIDDITRGFVQRAHGLGLKVVPYTLDTAAEVRRARDAGVDAVITDAPVRAKRVLDRVAPRVRAALLTGSKSAALRSGRLAARIALDEPGTAQASVVAGSATLASGFTRLRAPGSATASLRLTSAGRRALQDMGAVRVVLVVRAVDRFGNRAPAKLVRRTLR